MADKNLLSQMLEHLVNEDQAKAEELFHDYVVAASREIYEGLIESELKDEEVDEAAEEDEEDKVDEAAEEDEDKDDEDLDENFEDIAVEAGAEDDMGADPTDDLAGELDAGDEMGDEEGEEGEEQLFQDLEAIVDELQAKFDELKGVEGEEHGDEFGSEEGEEMPMKDEFELETVREYVEKVGTPKGGDNGANAKSIVAGKNDMGGTTANIAKGGEDKGNGGTQGGLAKPTTQLQDGGNVNVPGGNAGKTAFKKKETAKGGDDGDKSAAGLFRGRR